MVRHSGSVDMGVIPGHWTTVGGNNIATDGTSLAEKASESNTASSNQRPTSLLDVLFDVKECLEC